MELVTDTEEKKIPTDAEMMEALEKKIPLLKLRAKVQELNTRILEGKARELRAMEIISSYMRPVKDDQESTPEQDPNAE